jgi:hypothetical protein
MDFTISLNAQQLSDVSCEFRLKLIKNYQFNSYKNYCAGNVTPTIMEELIGK